MVELLAGHVPVHLQQDDLVRGGDDGYGHVGLAVVVLLLVEVEEHVPVGLAGRDGGDDVPHGDPGVGEGHGGRGEAGAPGPGVRLEDLDVHVDGRAGVELGEDHLLEGLGDDLGDLYGPPVRSGPLPVAHRERLHVVLALDDRLGGVLEMPGVALPGPVHRGQDLVLPDLHVRRAVRVSEHSRLYLDGPVLVRGPSVDPDAVLVYQYHIRMSAHPQSSSSCSSSS